MKPKFKIGSLIKFVEKGTERYDEITGVLTTTAKHFYVVGEDTKVDEIDVLQSYKAVKTRAFTKKKKIALKSASAA